MNLIKKYLALGEELNNLRKDDLDDGPEGDRLWDEIYYIWRKLSPDDRDYVTRRRKDTSSIIAWTNYPFKGNEPSPVTRKVIVDEFDGDKYVVVEHDEEPNEFYSMKLGYLYQDENCEIPLSNEMVSKIKVNEGVVSRPNLHFGSAETLPWDRATKKTYDKAENIPTLNNWCFEMVHSSWKGKEIPMLAGNVFGHESRRDGERVFISKPVAIEEDIITTASGSKYRLGSCDANSPNCMEQLLESIGKRH